MKCRLKVAPEIQKALEQEIQKQCREETKQHEIDFHTLWIYALHNRRTDPWGLARITELYKEMFDHLATMRKHQESSQDVDIPYHAMRYELKQDGIDVEKLFREYGEALLTARIVDK